MVVLGKVERDDELIKGSSQEGLQKLSECHPLVIEGMGDMTSEIPRWLPQHLSDQLRKHWEKSTSETSYLVTQGDPLEERVLQSLPIMTVLSLDSCVS